LRRPIGMPDARGNVHAAGSITDTASGIGNAPTNQFDAGNGRSPASRLRSSRAGDFHRAVALPLSAYVLRSVRACPWLGRQPAWIKTQNRKHKVNWPRGAGIRRWYDGWIAHTSARNATRGWSCNAPAVIAGPAKQSLPRGVQITLLRSQRRALLWRLSPLPLWVLSFSDCNDRLRSRPAPSLDAAARVQE
jgi:hypothetical protein